MLEFKTLFFKKHWRFLKRSFTVKQKSFGTNLSSEMKCCKKEKQIEMKV